MASLFLFSFAASDRQACTVATQKPETVSFLDNSRRMSVATVPTTSMGRRPVAIRLAETRRAYSDNVLYMYCNRSRRERRRRKKRWRSRRRQRPRKITIVGDMNCGKTSLISAYCYDKFSEVYQPTILRCISSDVKLRGEKIDIILTDTPGRTDYLPLRQCAYNKTDLVIICFALDQPATLDHVKDYWIHEVRRNLTNKIPIVLVGNRVDKRDEIYSNWCSCNEWTQKGFCWHIFQINPTNLQRYIVTSQHGQSVAREIGAHAYMECSAKYRERTREIFEVSTDVALKKYRRKRKHYTRGHESCIIL